MLKTSILSLRHRSDINIVQLSIAMALDIFRTVNLQKRTVGHRLLF